MEVKQNEKIPNERKQYTLSFNEYHNVCLLVGECEKIDFDKDYSKWFNSFIPSIKKYFPSSKIENLQKTKESSDIEVYAIKIDEKRPELYFIFSNGKFSVADQARCDIYFEGLFKKPTWTK